MKTPSIKQIKGHANYVIDENGKVWNQLTHQRVKEYVNPNGFSYVVLDGYWKTIAYLMKAAFFTDDSNMCVRHKDGDRTNNRLSNLYTFFDGSETLDGDGNEKKIIIFEVNPKSNEVIRFWNSVNEIADDMNETKHKVTYAIRHCKSISGRKFELYNGGNDDTGLFDYTDGKHIVKVFNELGDCIGEGKTLEECSKITGESRATLRACLANGCRTKHGYIYKWQLSTTLAREYQKPEEVKEIEEYKGKGRPITQYDRKGNIINVWKSVKEASEATGIANANIRASLNGVSTHAGGFVWRWKNDPFYKYAVTNETPEPSREVKEKPKRDPSTYKRDTQFTIGKRLSQYDKEGNLLKVWETASEAAQTLNINLALLGRAAKGKVKSAGGFYWGYEGEPFNIHSRQITHTNLKKPLYQLAPSPDGNGWIVTNEWDGVNEAARELGYPSSSLALCAKEPHKYKDGYYYSYTPTL